MNVIFTPGKKRNVGTKILSLVVMLLFINGFLTAQTTRTVCPTGCDHVTIQAAVDAAVANDIVVVSAGTYTEDLNLDKNISISGANAGVAAGVVPGSRGAETIIDGGFRVFAGGSGAQIDGVTIRNGRSYGSLKMGVAVEVNNVSILNTIIEEVSTPAQSDGITTLSGVNGLTVTNSTIQNNWRGIFLNPGSGHMLTGNLITSNNGVGVGIGSDGQSNLTLNGNEISNHTLEGMGASAVGAAVLINNNRFLLNGVSLAHYGGMAIDATCNWWGSDDYGDVLDAVQGDVLVFNYLVTNNIVTPDCSGTGPVYNSVQNKSYFTIPPAIAEANNGDEIIVLTGTFTDAFTIDKSITLKGANEGISGDGIRGDETILENAKITVVGSPTVVIDGFKIFQTDNSNEAVLLSSASNVTFENSILERQGVTTGNIVRAITTSAGTGVKIIRNNLFTGDVSGGLFGGHKTWNSGMYVNGAGSTVNIQDNIFENCRTAANLDDFGNGISLSGNTFDNNGTHLSFGGTSPTSGQYVLGINDFKAPASATINLSNVATDFQLDISQSTTDGNSFASLSLADLFLVEGSMYHRGRSGRNGLVTYVDNNQYVIPANPSIQAAVDFASSAGTIHVAAGAYTGNITLDKPLTLLGANQGVAGNGTRLDETILSGTFRIQSSDLEINGFEVTGAGRAFESSGSGPWSNIDIVNNRMVSNTGQQAILNGFGVVTTTIGSSEWNISNNLIDNILHADATAIVLFNVTALEILNNQILHQNNAFDGRRGVNLDGCRSVTFSENEVDLGLSSPASDNSDGSFTKARYTIQLSSSDRDTESIEISLCNLSGAYDGIITLGNGVFNDMSILSNEINNVVIGIRFQAGTNVPNGAVSSVTIQENQINSSSRSVYLQSGLAGGGTADTYSFIEVTGNSLLRSTSGFVLEVDADAVVQDGPIDASCNWWGSADLEDVLSAVSGDVNSFSYLVSNNLSTPDCSGIGPIINTTTNASYATIQQAVDASQVSDTIKIASGSYIGDVDATGSGVILAPGDSPGCVEIVGDVIFDEDNGLEIEINGLTVCTQYDQMDVTGEITLDDANLDLVLGFAPALGNSFEILTSGNPIVGQFTQGASITASYMSNDYVFSIDYSGNKVTLTACAGGVVNVTQSNKEYCSIQAAIDEANANDVITVAAGTYVEDVIVNKANLTISGADAATTIVSGPAGGDGGTFRVAASGVTIEGFTITREGNNTTDWNNPTLNFAGVAIQGQTNNAIIRKNIITGNRTGIDVNNSNGNQIIDNNIDFNRTGLIFRNQTDNTVMTGNFITDNWTSGVLFLDASGGTNSPVQSAINSQFNNNNISGNWYGDIVDRQVGGSLPAAGTTNLKNFECNWFGTTSPTVSTANSTEPGYAVQIPVAYGGTANNPGGAPNILGPASANFEFIPWGVDGTDNDAVAPGWQITPSTCTGQGPVKVYSDAALTTLVSSHLTIQAAIDAATTQNGYFVTVDAGTYFENVIVSKAVNIEGPQKDIDPRTAASSRTAGSIAEAIVDGGGGSSPVFEITVAGVVLNGLEITNGSGDLVSSPSGAPVKENVIVKYCIVHNSTGDEGIQLRNVENGGVEYCLVFDVAGDGINMCCGSTSSFVNFNEITGSGSNDASVYLYDNGPFMVVSNNLVYDNTADVGIMIGNKNGNDGNKNSSFTNNATVSNNSITGHTGSEVGLYVNTSRVIIMDNLITNWESTGDAALYLRYDIKDIEVSGNDISGNEHGIKISSGVSSTNATTLSIFENDLSGNTTYGIKNGSSGTVEANCNWFGTTVPSTIIAGIDGDVNFQPYLTSGGDSGANAPGFDPTGDCVGCLNGGLVTNTDTGKNFCSIQDAIDDVTTLNTHTIEIESGTYDEQILVNKSLSLIGVGLTNPIILFTGTVVGKPTLIDVSSPNVTIQELQLDVDLTKLSSGIIASATNVSGITIKDNVINATGSSAAASSGSYGNRNAVSINYGGSTNYRVAAGGVSGITFEGNTVSSSIDAFSVGRIFRAGVCTDEAGGTFTGNTIQSVNQDIQVRFGNNGAINIANNNLNGGGVDISDNNANAGTISITNNNFNSVFSNQFVTPRTAVLRLKNNQQNIETNITGNSFTDALWSISAENYRNVTIDNNTFSPPVAATDFVHIGVNTKSISSNSNSIVQTEVNGIITNNTFNGSGTLGGTAIGFFNHDSDNATFGNYTIGTAGNENEFGDLIGQYIRLDNQTGTTTGATNPTTYPGTGGWPTIMACWNQDYDIRNNLFNVGSGLQNTNSMSSAERATLENRLFHNPDASCVGSLTYFDPVTNITQNTSYLTISAAIAAANPGDEIELKEWEFNEKVIIDKSLTLQGVDKFNVILDGTGLGNASGIEILNGVTNVTIQNLTVQNYQGAGPNLFAGIYAVGGNDGLNIQNVNVFDNIGGTGIYANGPVDNVTINAATVSGHTNVAGAARGIVIWNGHKSNITITNCTVTDNNCCGIELQDGTASGVTISDNTIQNNADNGIGVVGLTSGDGPNLITNNLITNCGRFGIEVKNPDGTGLESGDGAILVEGNTVARDVPIGSEVRDIAGIAVFRRGVLTGNIDVPTGVVVKGNDVFGYLQPSTSEGFGIVVEGSNHTVANNTIQRCNVGLQFQVGHLPYPGDGDQANLPDQYFGRGNSPVTCQVTDGDQIYGMGGFFGNGVNFRPVGFDDYANENARGVTNTNTGKIYCSIQGAIDNALTLDGHVLEVAAATYVENVSITKSLDIRGPNYNVSPNSATRDSEAILLSATDGGYNALVSTGSNNVSFRGFLLDGNNPNLAANGYGTDGSNIHAAMGVSFSGTSGLMVKENIFRNLGYFGVRMGASSGSSTDSEVVDNLFENLGTYNNSYSYPLWGGGVLLQNNTHAYVANNVMENVRLGIQTNQIAGSHAGLAKYRTLEGNVIEARRRGIFFNEHYSTSPWTVSENTITALHSTDETLFNGMLIAGQWNVSSSFIDNDIDGSGTSHPSTGIDVWNVSVNHPTIITGGNITDVNTGIYINNYASYPTGPNTLGAYATINGVNIDAEDIGIRLSISDQNSNNVSVNAAITNSFIIGGADGIGLDEDIVGKVNATINENSIVGSTGFAINSEVDNLINATCNWYGTTDFVAINSAISGDITFSPYLENGTDNAPGTPGFQPVPGSCTGTPVEIISAVQVSPILCGGVESSIEVTFTGGGIGTYEISWDGTTTGSVSGIMASPYEIMNLPAGSYTVTVSAANSTTDISGPVVVEYLPVHNTTADTYHASIQSAINEASGNDVIEVCAGIYAESVTVNKPLDIRGANYGTPVTGRTFATASESFVQTTASGSAFTMQGGSSGSSIRGFSLGSVGDAGNRGVNMITGLSNVTISENIISGFTPGLAVSVAAGSTNITVAENDITNAYAGIYLSANATNNFVLRNLIHDLAVGAGPDQGSGIVLEGNNTNTSISENVLTNNEHGVYVWTGYGNDFSGTNIYGNSITGNTLGIDNTNPGNVVATCNWWGSTNFAVINALISGDVTFSPYSENGTDHDNMTIGFQAVPGSCTGTPVEITSAVQVLPITCGNSVSSILVSFDGGSVPFDISWDGAAVGNASNVTSPYEITNLPAGDYMITVTSANNSSDMTGPVTIEYLPVHNSTLNTYHATIQAAIDGATTGNVIQICAGTYAENLVVDESVELRGPNYGINPNTGTRVAEAIITPDASTNLPNPEGDFSAVITIDAEDVVIDGLRVTGDNGLPANYVGLNIQAGVGIRGNESGLNVTNNILDRFTAIGIWTARSLGDVNSLGSIQNVNISQNLLEEMHDIRQLGFGFGIYAQGTDGSITNNVVKKTRNGLQVQPYGATGGGAVTGNSFEVYRNGFYYNYAETGSGPWNVSGNVITAINPPSAITGGAIVWDGIAVQTMRNNCGPATITDNSIDGSGVSIASADFSNIIGYRVRTPNNGAADPNTFSNNKIVNVEEYIHNETAQILNATCNWYGTEDPQVITDGISGDVAYLPFLVEDNDYGTVNPTWSTDLFSCIGVGPVVVYDQDPSLPGTNIVSSHMTIQAAIDATTTLSGHYVAVSSGNYDELVTIDKEVTLSGFGADNTLLQSSNPLATNILSIEANNVSVKDIAIVGPGAPSPATRGIYVGATLANILIENVISTQHNYGVYVGATADVTGLTVNNTVLNINGNGLQIEAEAKVDGLTIVDGEMSGNLFGLSAAATFAAYDNSEDLKNVSITGSEFINNQFFGLLFNKGKDVTLDGITVDGNGDVAGAPGAGIYFTWREGTYDDIHIMNSAITNNGNDVDATGGAGILIRPRANATISNILIENNNITGNGFVGNGSAGIRILRNNDDAGSDPDDIIITGNNISSNANHNISSTTSLDINASCNWWGTDDGTTIATTVNGNVDFGPFLTAGGDSGSAAPGFSPTGTCDGCESGTVTNISLVPNKYYCSIQEAIDDPDTENGHTIMVAAGIYVENIKVTKSLAILGPNDAVEACSGTRSTEAIIYPAISDIDWATADGTIIEILASDVTISGFTIDGDNPDIATGKTNTTSADIDAAEGITRYGTGDNLVITNNIIQNLSYFAITMYDYPDGIASAGNIVSGNLIKDLGTYDGTVTLAYWGGGILLHNNQYASVTNNCMENVRVGIQTGNFYRTNPGAPSFQVIESNTIQARRRGIFHNLAYSNASPITLNNNTITGLVNSNETLWDGILLSSLSVPSTTSNNMVNGAGLTIATEGIEVWNVKNSSPAVISGGSISNVGIGLFLNNYEGYASNAGDGAHATVSDMTITPTADGIGVRVLDSPSSTTHAKVNVSLDDVIINGGLEGVKFEESQAGTVGGSITNNTISSDSIGINVTRAQTSGTNSLSISGNTINNANQQNDGGNPTIGILLTNLSGTAAATVSNNDISGPFYGYVGYNINTTPATTISGGDITGIMQGVAVVNTVGGPLAPSTVNVSGTSMSGFTGTSANPANNFHNGIYTFTAGGTTTSNGLNLNVDNVSITGTGVPSQASGGIYLADFSGGGDFVQTVTVENSTISDNANRGVDARGKVDLTLTGNTLSNNGFNAFSTGGNDGFSVLAQQNAQVLATQNFITLPAASTTKAFGLATGNGATNLITANDNSILFNGNTTAGSKSANSPGTGTINAACNWWGVLCLEDIEALTSGNVNIPTWLINGSDDDPMATGFQPTPGACLYNKPVVTDPTPVTICSGGAINVMVGNMDDVPLVITKYDIEVVTPVGVTSGMSNAAMPATDVVDFNYILNDEYSNVTGAVQTVTYIVTPYFSDCPGESYNIEVVINSEPVGSNTTVGAVCSDVAFDLNPQAYITNSVASSFTWTAAYDSGLTGGSASGSGNVVGTLNNETDFVLNAYFTVTPTAALGGCVGASYMVVVPISPTPDVNDITVDVCSNEAMSLDLNDYVDNDISVAFTWELTTANFFIEGLPEDGTSDDISSGLVTNLATVFRTAVYTVQTTADVPGCAGNSFLLTVKVNPQPNVNMSSNGPLALCENETRVLGATGTNGASPYTYHWSITGTTGSVTANLNSLSVFPVVAASPTLGASGSGTVTVEVIAVDNFGCSSEPQNLTFDVGSAPVANAIVGPTSACQLTTTTYTVTNVNPSSTYTWTIFSGGVIVTSNVGPSIDATWVSALSGPHTIQVIEQTNGCSTVNTLPVSILPLPSSTSMSPIPVAMVGDVPNVTVNGLSDGDYTIHYTLGADASTTANVTSSGGVATFQTRALTAADEGALVAVTLIENNTTSCPQSVSYARTISFLEEVVEVNIHMLLAGPHNAGMMNTTLNILGYLPTDQPYTTAPFSYNGSETLATIPMTMVDWVLVRLRDKNDPTLIIATRAAILHNDGEVTDVDGVSPVEFILVPDTEYYIEVNHRNHLGAMTLNPVTIDAMSLMTYDFRTDPTFGTNAQRLVSGSYMLWAGDGNQDGFISYNGPINDRISILTVVLLDPGNTSLSPNYTVSGYYTADFNMDGNVQNSGPTNDGLAVLTSVLLNPSNSMSSPGFVLIKQLP